MNRKVLLIEPNYSNKYPPIGLMKIATYYKQHGDKVVFFKGNLKSFVIERIAERCLDALEVIEPHDWWLNRDTIIDYIRTKRSCALASLRLETCQYEIQLTNELCAWKEYFWRGKWKEPQEREWDRVGVTTLFTFYWDITVETINFAKLLVKNQKDLMVGGVLASIQPDELEAKTGIRPHVGILRPGDLDKGDTTEIDSLPLDYSILDEIDYKYPMNNAYFGYATRGCIRKCPFCAVPTLEPQYCSYISLKKNIEGVRKKYGEQKDLLLMDNNILASADFERIINDIIDCGFGKGSKFIQPDELEISIRNLKNGTNDRAYIRKTQQLIMDFYQRLKNGSNDTLTVYKIIFEQYHINKLATTNKTNLLSAYNEIYEIYQQHKTVGKGKLRFVDFNQGVDARLFNEQNVKLLAKIAIRPLRIAFDDLKTKDKYCNAIRLSVKAGLKDFSNYLLYNFNDTPDELYKRLEINVLLSDELNVSIYSFPMKYHPLRKTPDMDRDYSHNRDYIGKHWNRKYIRAIQAILNSTKGKIGRGEEFFRKAFGHDINEFHQLLEMPETMIIYRLFFEWLDTEQAHNEAIKLLGDISVCHNSTSEWWNTYNHCKSTVNEKTWLEVELIIHKNEFDNKIYSFENKDIAKLISFYVDNRKTILDPTSDLYKMKQAYDKNPTIKIRHHKKL